MNPIALFSDTNQPVSPYVSITRPAYSLVALAIPNGMLWAISCQVQQGLGVFGIGKTVLLHRAGCRIVLLQALPSQPQGDILVLNSVCELFSQLSVEHQHLIGLDGHAVAIHLARFIPPITHLESCKLLAILLLLSSTRQGAPFFFWSDSILSDISPTLFPSPVPVLLPHFERLIQRQLDSVIVGDIIRQFTSILPRTAPEYVDVILTTQQQMKADVYRLLDLYATRNPTSECQISKYHLQSLTTIVMSVEYGFTPQEEFLGCIQACDQRG